jgi:SET domain-containing protein
LESEKNLKVQPSTIEGAGRGLFAFNKKEADNEIVFHKGDRITSYNGEFIDRDVLLQRYDVHTAPYGIQYDRDTYINSALLRGIGSLINHTQMKNTNVRFSVDRRNTAINLVATKNVRNGDELLVNYGRDYEFEDNYKVRPYPTKE